MSTVIGQSSTTTNVSSEKNSALLLLFFLVISPYSVLSYCIYHTISYSAAAEKDAYIIRARHECTIARRGSADSRYLGL